ncbi:MULTISPECIES: restriction endonuclease [Shewanella]|uniref:restriction endonuclease n=1 Tax=Shewanella TaxID=22 RepID=UPI002119B8EB|nr:MULTISPECIES: restriction endonuclease [Shewanella]
MSRSTPCHLSYLNCGGRFDARHGLWWQTSHATQYSSDSGIEGIIKEDKLGLDSIYLQAKRYRGTTIGRPETQAFAGALDIHHARKGVFIISSSFSKDARHYVSSIEKRIVLIDGNELAGLMIAHNVGVTTHVQYAVKAIDSDYFLKE